MYSIYITNNVSTIFNVFHNIILVKCRAKSCDPKNKNSGAKHNAISILRVQIVLLYCMF